MEFTAERYLVLVGQAGTSQEYTTRTSDMEKPGDCAVLFRASTKIRGMLHSENDRPTTLLTVKHCHDTCPLYDRYSAPHEHYKVWHKYGQEHRDDDRPCKVARGHAEWRQYGRRRRVSGGPTVVTARQIEFHVDDCCHRDDKPAVIEIGKTVILEWWHEDDGGLPSEHRWS